MTGDIGLGKPITGDPPKDAVHVAVFPAVTGDTLYPGEHVAIDKGIAMPSDTPIGVVDPFITASTDPIPKGTKVWVLLYPGSITSLRHDWTHPSFPLVEEESAKQEPSAEAVAEAMKWMEGFAPVVGYKTGADVVDAVGITEGFYAGNTEIYDYEEDFWKHYKTITGKEPPDERPYFSCAC